MSRKFVLIALGTVMTAPAWAQQTPVGSSVVRSGRISPLDTMRAMLQRRNPTVEEVLALAADIAKRTDDYRAASERMRREQVPGEVRARFAVESKMMFEELLESQRILARACADIRPHENESEGVLGFQIEKATDFQARTPLVKEERFTRNPEIIFIHPNSPAAKADIREGDVWVAIAGKDLVNTYVRELNDVLKPGNRVDLKLRRDGREVSVDVVAKTRPPFPEEACSSKSFDIRQISGAGPHVQLFTGPTGGGRDFFTMRVSKSIFGGAVFSDLTKDQREAFPKVAADEGVLVESVNPGSPAEVAGLRAFDVITRANNQVVDSPIGLIKIIQSSAGPVSLWVVKGDQQRKVLLPNGR